MKPITTKTGFDCLAFKQLSQDKMAKEMKNLSHVEQVKYLKKKLMKVILKHGGMK